MFSLTLASSVFSTSRGRSFDRRVTVVPTWFTNCSTILSPLGVTHFEQKPIRDDIQTFSFLKGWTIPPSIILLQSVIYHNRATKPKCTSANVIYAKSAPQGCFSF